jgi:hypothetical protein
MSNYAKELLIAKALETPYAYASLSWAMVSPIGETIDMANTIKKMKWPNNMAPKVNESWMHYKRRLRRPSFNKADIRKLVLDMIECEPDPWYDHYWGW